MATGKTTLSLLALVASVALVACSEMSNIEKKVEVSSSVGNLGEAGLAGRLFDNWYKELDIGFVPDDETTPEADGQGGPNGDGTLNGVDGRSILNTGHQYRFKNLFGWDLLGDAGIYGAEYQDKPFILETGPANDQQSREVWIERLQKGHGELPSYADVLTEEQIALIVDFMLAMRNNEVPERDEIWRLSTNAPEGFILIEGGNAERGLAIYEERCADCHGAEGTVIPFNGGEQNIGLHARYYGYAVSMKILFGDPGTEMFSQLDDLNGQEKIQHVKDLLAAMCDRQQFPRGDATDPEVPDGDLRCGTYLR